VLGAAKVDTVDLAERLEALDLSLFDRIESQTTQDDRRSLLALHCAAARRFGSFGYLEIGSHLGGSLQTFIADPRCARIVSIDPRPQLQPDDRGAPCRYDGNSTERMLALLAGVPGASLTKLTTIERASTQIDPRTLPPLDLCLIDGEHTRRAALEDARFCLRAIGGSGVIVFHDRSVVYPAICTFVSELAEPYRAYPLRSELFAVEFGARSLLGCPRLRSRIDGRARVWLAANRLGVPGLLVSDRVRRRRGLR
jgi:hypothetical protein